jgi:monoamine oxidase
MLHGSILAIFGIAAALASDDSTKVDVVIIGGGASGTYAAVQLHDLGKSVIVVEEKSLLGGHTNTYVDPQTNIPIDYGVIVFQNISVVHNYFNRLKIPFEISPIGSPGNNTYVNLNEGKVIANFIPSNPANALAAYGAQVARYPGLNAGFDLPNPVPDDLVLPFGEFVQKYNLGDAVQVIADFAQGHGDVLKQMTLNIFKVHGLQSLQSMQTGFLVTANHDDYQIYANALQVLGSDKVLLNSKVTKMDRSFADHVEVTVKTPSGSKVIKACKLLMSIPPKLHNLVGFDLDQTEHSLFSQFINTAYYTGLIRNT